MRILEEFWYGNIEPTEYDTSSCKEYKKLLELICRNEEKLKATMTDEQKELFEKYTDCVREHQTNANSDKGFYIITERTLSEYYELDVAMKAAAGFRCMIFRNSANQDGVKLVF